MTYAVLMNKNLINNKNNINGSSHPKPIVVTYTNTDIATTITTTKTLLLQ